MIKAVFFDIDGTLVPFGAPGIPKEVSDAIARMRRNGTKVFIATGRHPSWIDNLGDTEFDGYYNRKNEMSIFQKRNEQIFSFFASFFLLPFRPLKHRLKADFKPLKQA